MKINDDKSAVVQALQECFVNIPFLKMGEVSINEKKFEPDFQVELQIKNKSFTILGEYKNSGEPRIARLATYQIKDWVSKGIGTYGIFIAPYISTETAIICSDAGIGYLDLSGNCLLSFETIFIHREGKVNLTRSRKLRSLYSKKAERILRVLLAESKQNWKTETLAKTAKVSYGQVAKVKDLLADREWLVPNESGIRLRDLGIVLDEWATQYRFKRNQIIEYYAMDDVAECEAKLANICERKEIRYVMTAFSGAARLLPTVRYQRMIAYIDDDPNLLADTLGWKRVNSGSNVNLLVPYDEGVFFGAQEIDGVQIASPIQIYLDLQDYRNRGQEAAQNIRKVIEQSWR